jgi:hypothetical protein
VCWMKCVMHFHLTNVTTTAAVLHEQVLGHRLRFAIGHAIGRVNLGLL